MVDLRLIRFFDSGSNNLTLFAWTGLDVRANRMYQIPFPYGSLSHKQKYLSAGCRLLDKLFGLKNKTYDTWDV